VETTPKFTLLLYDGSWGLSIFEPAADDPVYCATSDWSRLPEADVVLFHVPTAPKLSTVRKYRGQKWVAYSMESGVNYPRLSDPEYLAHFNLRMTYQWDSDVPLMYWNGRFRSLLFQPPGPKTGAAEAVFVASNARTASRRTDYARELMRYLPVDCYGRVLHNCDLPEDKGSESKLSTIARYRFNLAFENSIARDYVTEKFFDPLLVGCVPVYRGAPNVEEFAPGDHCFINTADFPGPRELAEYLLHLAANPAEYEAYFAWKSRPLRPAFLQKVEIAERDALRRLCECLLARGFSARRPSAWTAALWPWGRQASVG
jgi:Glycosyltransferase family 10 (fucosyltransferase) C-term/Fucosyltransferase, N-terminal